MTDRRPADDATPKLKADPTNDLQRIVRAANAAFWHYHLQGRQCVEKDLAEIRAALENVEDIYDSET